MSFRKFASRLRSTVPRPINWSVSMHRYVSYAVAAAIGSGAAIGGTSMGTILAEKPVSALSSEAREAHPSWQAGTVQSGIPTLSRTDVKKHSTENDLWVTYRSGVYNLTTFLDEHPGNRSRLLLATGGSHDIGSFWKQLGQHNQEEVHTMLERYRVANLVNNDVMESDVLAAPIIDELRDARKAMNDYAFSFEPFIAETPSSVLADNYYTPVEWHYVRNHFPVPTHLEMNDSFTISGVGVPSAKSGVNTGDDDDDDDDEGYSVSYSKLRDLKATELDCFIQCGGHRRREYNAFGETKGSKWDVGAIGNGKYRGVLLTDILAYIGVDLSELKRASAQQPLHVCFIGADCGPGGEPYAVSIPLEKVLSETGMVMVAYEHNGEPLTRDHGYPARVLVPGWLGARSVKWIDQIIIADKQSDSESFTKSYRLTSDNKREMRDVAVNSAIHYPMDGSVFHLNELDGTLNLNGEAHSGDGRSIVRVDVSIDGGGSWHSAALLNSDPNYDSNYAWQKWKVDIPIDNNYLQTNNYQLHLVCRAFDSSFNRQPQTCEDDIVFNPKGYAANPYHRITVNVLHD